MLCEPPGVGGAEPGEVLADQRRHRLGQAGGQQGGEPAAEQVRPRGTGALQAYTVEQRALHDLLAGTLVVR